MEMDQMTQELVAEISEWITKLREITTLRGLIERSFNPGEVVKVEAQTDVYVVTVSHGLPILVEDLVGLSKIMSILHVRSAPEGFHIVFKRKE
jgi:hypothetical protein